MGMEFARVEDVLRNPIVGKEYSLRGWAYRTRHVGGLVFVVLRDSTGILQVVVEQGAVPEEDFEQAKQTTVESSLQVRGVLREEARAPGGYELHARSYRLVHKAERFPITKDKSDEFLLDNRHLWVRSRQMNAILKIRSTVFWAIHEWFRENGYYEVQGPMFVGAAVEGGATLFEVPYFGRKAYLTQSSQFYLEALIFSLERVYTIAPSFRAEKSRTRRHLTEFWHAEAEVAWYGNEDMMKDEERLVEHVVQTVLDERVRELELLSRDTEPLERVKAPFPRVRFTEVRDMLTSMGYEVPMDSDLGIDEETAISKRFEKPFFITHFPREAKAFYHRPDPSDPRFCLNHDMLAPEGYGEIIGGGERIWELDVLLERIREEGLNPEDYKWYIDLRRYGSVPHAGYGLGVDRLVTWIADLGHIKYAIPFPRTIRRLRP